MTADPPPADGDLEVLGRLARILDRGAVELWARADQRPANDPSAAEIAGLAADFFFAHAHVAHLLPPDHVIEPGAPGEPAESDAVVLAVAAQRLVLDLPPEIRASAGRWAPHRTLEAMVGDLAAWSRAVDA